MTSEPAENEPAWRCVPEGWPKVPTSELEAFSIRAAQDIASSLDLLEAAFSFTTPPIAAVASRWQISDSLSAADLLLLACVGTSLPYAAADRLLASSSWHRTAILHAASDLDDGIGLVMAGPWELSAMQRLHAMVDAALVGAGLRHSTRDETAVFLCSRLRPRLFPPSTRLAGAGDARERWQLYRAALDHPAVRAALCDARTVSPHVRPMEELAILELAGSIVAGIGRH